MKPKELDNLWKMYREFVIACTKINMTNNATEFLAYLEKYQLNHDNPKDTDHK